MIKKNLFFMIFFLVALCGLLLILGHDNFSPKDNRIIKKKISDPQLNNPSDIIRFQGKYVVTEMLENRLAYFDDLSLNNIQHFDPKSIGKSFRSPHFLSISPWGSLLISNGWGNSIVEIKDLKGNGWKEFSGIDKKFSAPNGLCSDKEGWIYVGDSLNSRLVRFKDMEGKDWQIFPDYQKKISYIRELVCQDGVIWVSNSYENRPGLNRGIGSNVLKISNFNSGEVEEIAAIRDANITGIIPLKEKIVVGLWGGYNSLASVDLRTRKLFIIPGSNFGFGVPYGTFNDLDSNIQIVTYFGSFDKKLKGGIIVLRL